MHSSCKSLAMMNVLGSANVGHVSTGSIVVYWLIKKDSEDKRITEKSQLVMCIEQGVIAANRLLVTPSVYIS